ncbi:MAG: APC family permease [bacterium]|nr:APC family permease [bacterium]
MEFQPKSSLPHRLRKIVIGGARDLQDQSLFHKLTLIAFFAWVGLGADGLSSSCYGPEEAFLTLGKHHYLALFVAMGTALTIFIVSASYSQIVELFPAGGGGYLVASKLLGPHFGMVSGCALLIDYVLTITMSVASGSDALFSFFPPEYLVYKLPFAVLGVILLILLNLRGVKESVLPLVPIFLIFIAAHLLGIGYAIYAHFSNFEELAQRTITDVQTTQTELGMFGMVLLIMRAYSMGAGTFTGIEAVSNGVPILRDPKVHTAKRTMMYMAVSLAVMVCGLMVAYLLYGVEHQPGKTLNAVLFGAITASWGGWGNAFFLVVLISEATILFVAAQTGFLDGPRVLANMAHDRWMPGRFAMLSDRFVTQNGVILMGGAALLTMLATRGSVRFLVVLYSINVFITFVLSQSGMVRHWWQERGKVKGWARKLAINGIGTTLCVFILISVAVLKFYEGGWITLFITGLLALLVLGVKRHYRKTGKLLRKLENLVQATKLDIPDAPQELAAQVDKCDPHAKTAVLFVNGFNGLGLHTLFSIIRLFSGTFRNFVFVQVGVVDAGNFKGSEAIHELRQHINVEVERYIEYMKRHGYHAEGHAAIGTDVLDEVMKMAPQIMDKFPNSVFFGGQLVFPEETFVTKLLHNNIVFALQRKFYHIGIPFIILPIKVA